MKRSGFKQRGKPLARSTFTSKPKAMKRKSSKSRQPKSATGPMVQPAYANAVRALPCCACGVSGPSDIHHCKDRPPADADVYRYFPGYGERSADFDGIPLCRPCHDMFHRDHGAFHAAYGADWQFIAQTRAIISKQKGESTWRTKLTW